MKSFDYFQMIRFVLLLICIKLGDGFPEGAPGSVCTSMMPQHDVGQKQCQSKYIIESEKSQYDSGDVIRITVRGLTKDDSFKGILVTAKNENNQRLIGTWSVENPSVKTIPCNGIDSNAITHSSADKKLEITAFWHAPSNLSNENTIIRATVVKSYAEIYVGCFNLTLTPKQNQSSSTPSIKTNTEKDMLLKPNTNITWKHADDVVTVTMTTRQVNVGEWRAIGFSLDRQMGDEYVFICQLSSTDDVLLRRMHTKLGKRAPSPTNEDVNVINTAYENGHATCEFSFEITTEQADGEPAPIAIDKNYYLTFAAGLLKTEEELSKHSYTFITSKMYQLQTPEAINLDESLTTTTILTGPSTTPSASSSIGSTAIPQTRDVGVNISWTYSDGLTNVKMIVNNLKTSQWSSIGFSLDDSMGEDHVFLCQRLADDTVSLQRLINPLGHSRPILADTVSNPGGIFNVSRRTVEDGVVHCDFTLSNFVGARRQPRQTDHPELSQTTSYQPLIAIGNLDSSNNLIRHSFTSRAALPQGVLLNRQETITYNIEPNEPASMTLMKAHSIIMVFTWIVLVSTGILIARYFKRSWTDRKICNKAVWFAVHRTIMTCAALLTLLSFLLILVYKKGQWTSKLNRREFTHSIIGMLVICFALIQPFMALFRCNPNDRYRFIFNYAHAIVGMTGFALSIAAIFLAMFFTQFRFQLSKEWIILVAWSCWLPIVFVGFETTEIYFRKYSSSMGKSNSYDLTDRKETTKIEAMPMRDNVNKGRIKGLLLSLHIIIASGLALALVILISQS